MIRRAIRGAGEVCITLGLIVLLFAAYEVYGKAWMVAQDQKRLDRALEEQWERQSRRSDNNTGDQSAGQQPTPEPVPLTEVEDGDPLTRLHIPALRKNFVVVEGTTPADIRLAPGHYRESQYPGEIGNFAVAGHRMPAIFWDLDKLGEGDAVVVEDADNYYIYRVYQTRIVSPTDVYVVAPNPDDPSDADPQRALLTLTTCNPKLDNYERLIVHAEMERVHPKADGKPSELR